MPELFAPTISRLHLYPAKSLGGLAVPQAVVEPRGLRHDRRWMVTNPDGLFLTQRALPRMALIAQTLEPEHLRFDAPGMTPLRVPLTPPPDAPAADVRVWRSTCRALLVGPEADCWLGEWLGTACRLVFMPDETRRPVNPDFGGDNAIVSFADGYPLLLLSEASLRDLNSRLDTPVPMERFRPNIVVDGIAPYAEDAWKTLRIGAVTFRVAKPCDRCALITVDQETGVLQGPEPLRTLASYRTANQQVLFGQYLIPQTSGVIDRGQSVQATP